MNDADQVYRAVNLSQAAGNTWELRVPEQPRLVTDLVRVQLGEAVHLLGGVPQTLAGASVGWLLTTLAPLLDGSRTFRELMLALGDVSAPELADVLHFLQMHGLLEEGKTSLPATWRSNVDARVGAQLTFFSRYLRLTGLRRSRYEAQLALESARIGLLGDAACVEIVGGLLTRAGVLHVHALNHALEAGAQRAPGNAAAGRGFGGLDLIVVFAADDDGDALAAQLARAQVPCLYADPERASVGPLSVWGCSPCPTCVRLQLPVRSRSVEGPNPALAPAVRALWQRALAARVAAHAVMYVTGITPPLALEHIECWNPAEGTSSFHPSVQRLPDCPICGDGAGARGTDSCSDSSADVAVDSHADCPPAHGGRLARLFHGAAMLQPWHVRQPAGMQGHLTPNVARLQGHAMLEHGGAARHELTVGDDNLRRTGHSPGREDPTSGQRELGWLATLLHGSFGGHTQPLEGGGRRFVRSTASAGNLGSAEAFLAVNQAPGLAPGAYHYVLGEGARGGGVLECLTRCDAMAALADCVTDPGARGAILGASVVLAIVSAVERVCEKYQARGYTYAMLDAGLMAHRIEILSRASGLEARFIRHFSDAGVSRLFGLDGVDLAPTLLVSLKGMAP